MRLGLAAVGLEIGIHLQGTGSRISCAAILIAGVVRLLPTLLATSGTTGPGAWPIWTGWG